MKPYRLDRFRSYDYGTLPVCGLPEGHSGDCMSEESLRRYREKRNAGRRERYIGNFVFTVREHVPNSFISINPLGLTITYFREDQAFQ